MPMPAYPIPCTHAGCNAIAQFKVAGRWSDGITFELKTYALACRDCLGDSFRSAIQKRLECRLAAGESLEVPAIFEMQCGSRDRELLRRSDLEAEALQEIA